MANERIQNSIARIEQVRKYTRRFLADLTPDQWFWMPEQGITHIAWQVGHLAFAEYALCMKRQRGERPEDAKLFPNDFIPTFGRGSTPIPGKENYPSIEDLSALLDSVHAAAKAELLACTDEQLKVPASPEHPMFQTNLEALEWCAEHEAVHVGQIILLRRLMGIQPTF